MSAMSNYLEKALNDHVLGNTAYSASATVHFALFTAVTDGDAGTVTEVSTSATGYARASVTNNTTNFPGATSGTGSKSNGTQITFPTATGAWGTVTHWGIYTAASGGTNLLYWGELTAARSIVTGDTPRFNAGDFTITFE